MRIVIGDTPAIGPAGQYRPEMESGMVEARVLDIRQPRKRRGDPPTGQVERRENEAAADPVSGRIVTLLVPEGYKLPRGLESGNYRIFLRFVQRGPKA